MLASTFYDPVLGIDIHIVLVPAPPAPAPIPTPVPMPFIGMVFDPMGLVVGAAIGMAMGGGPGLVTVNELPATNCGTEATLMLTSPHIPAPGVAFASGMPGNDAELYFGSLDVTFAGSQAVRLGDLALSCSDPIRLPTSAVLALPKGCPVLVIRPPVPDVAAIAMAVAFRVGMRALRALARAGGRVFRFLRRMQRASPRWARVSSRIRGWVDNIAPERVRARINRGVCHVTGHPVDVATGRVFTEVVDFELPGPIPLEFERVYDSSSSWRDGVLGHGWSHSLDQAVWCERGKVIYRAEDGREIEFHVHDRPGRAMRPGAEVYLAPERLTLRCLDGGSWEILDHGGITHEFAPVPGGSPAVAKLTGKRDRNGHRIELSYDDRGLLDVVRDSGGRLVRFEHDRDRRLVDIKLPMARGRGWSSYRKFHYDGGDLVRATDSLGHEWQFEYVTHLLVRETDRTGLSFYFQYDGLGSGAKCIRTWGDGGIYDHVISYDVANHKTVVEDSVGGVTVYEMDDVGQVVAVTDPVGARTEFEYDGDCGKVTVERTPSGAETHRHYDARGNVTRVTAPDGAVTSITWHDRFALPIAVEDPIGATWLFRFDRNGNLEETASPVGGLTFYERRDGLLERSRDATGAETLFEYDEHRNLRRVVLPNGGEVTYGYDGRGNIAKVRDPVGVTTATVRDSEGRPLRFEFMLGLKQELAYDPEGNVTEIRDANRHIRLRHGCFHRLAEREEDGARVAFGYDTECRLRTVTNEAGEVYSFKLDRGGRVTAETGFDGERRAYVLDVEGKVTQKALPSGRMTDLSYDTQGRVISVRHSDGTGSEFEYDERGQVARALNESADVRFERDELGRVVAESQDGGQTWVRSGYGASGRRESLRSDLGARQDVEVDHLGEIVALVHGGGEPGAGAPARVLFRRNAAGLEMARELPGGVEVAWSRDKLGRPLERQTTRRRDGGVGAGAEVLDVRSYQWRGADQIAAIINASTGPSYFDHDGRGRLVRERNSGGAIERAMDAVGNVYRTAAGSDRRYGRGGLLKEADGTRFEHDADGNRILRVEPEGHRWKYVWNGAGLLSQVTLPDGRRVRFGYDAFARRTSKQVMSASAGEGAEVLESEMCFVWDEHSVLHALHSDTPATTWYWEPGTLAPVMKRQGDAWHGIVADHLGTPTEMYDEIGALAWSMPLDVFGARRLGIGAARDCPWRWPGQYEDEETGLYYNRHRYYAPQLAAYASPDPLFAAIEPTYGYLPDPTSQVDPMGLHVVEAYFTPERGLRAPVENPNLGGAPRWPNTPGSGANTMAPSGLGRLGDSENLLLEHLADSGPERPLQRGVLEIVSTPAHGSSLPPCDFCGEGMQRFADTYTVTVVYTRTGRRGMPIGEPRVFRPTCG